MRCLRGDMPLCAFCWIPPTSSLFGIIRLCLSVRSSNLISPHLVSLTRESSWGKGASIYDVSSRWGGSPKADERRLREFCTWQGWGGRTSYMEAPKARIQEWANSQGFRESRTGAGGSLISLVEVLVQSFVKTGFKNGWMAEILRHCAFFGWAAEHFEGHSRNWAIMLYTTLYNSMPAKTKKCKWLLQFHWRTMYRVVLNFSC